ncbi:isochorismatase family protein [Ectothiorhodospira mobilis]|uniref:isochorismatase family protein n=1 Tax=Ectothiorhodospira mobilis TaxID=195064 RepID=UPI0019080CF6|nr:isochorismatase family protein [Ectothiorhodospira mobilis]MBK1692193.1 nicotinamidase [Ectothiorhodospira mobilis]
MGDTIDPLLRPGDALLVVDVQNDFCPGGRLPIPLGDRVIPVLNRALEAARARGLPVYASRDWHPLHHPSFTEQGGPWPVHCLQDTPGAAFHPELDLPAECITVTKGTRFDKDQYSAFDETGLEQELRRQGVQRLWIGGLAEDVCVEATARDAVGLGFAAVLLPGGALPVSPEGGEQARARMARDGVVLQPGPG